MSNRYALYRFDDKRLDGLISKGFEQFGIDKKLENSKLVMIKPNLVSDVEEYIRNGSNTDVRIIESVLKYLSKFKCKVVIAESETGTKIKGRKLQRALDLMGVTKLKNKYNFSVVNLTYDDKKEIRFENSLILKKLEMGKNSLDADLIINIPKLKTHKYSTITCALKNMFGCVPDPVRIIYHHNIHKTLADLNTLFIDRTFVVLDGIRCMEGNAPVYGNPIDMNIIGFSDDMLVNDYVASRIIKINPLDIKHIKFFKQKYHPINFDKIEEIGDIKIEDVAIKFKPAKKNWFIRIEEQLMRNKYIVRFLFSNFVQENFTYHFRNIFKKFRGGSYRWYLEDEK